MKPFTSNNLHCGGYAAGILNRSLSTAREAEQSSLRGVASEGERFALQGGADLLPSPGQAGRPSS